MAGQHHQRQTRRAYKRDVSEFSSFTGLTEPTQLRTVARAHVIAWRKDMEMRALSPATLRRKLSALYIGQFHRTSNHLLHLLGSSCKFHS